MPGEAARAFVPIAGLHHAGRDHAAGFCVFNDCGVAIEYLRDKHGLQRIAYVDIDAHHGDGVFYGFEDDPDLIFADIHEDGRYLYPGTGAASETGKGRAAGTKLNIPLPPGAGDTEFDEVWPAVMSHLRAARPEFIIMQCGADSLEGDPITHLRFTENAHARAAADLCRLADEQCNGRIVGTGGGGYNRHNLARAWTRVVQAFAEIRRTHEPYITSLATSCTMPPFLAPAFSRPDTYRERLFSMFAESTSIENFDSELFHAIVDEARRQEEHIELIASENYASPRVMEAQGSVLTNKYAEGYPGKRYYGGCEYVDVAERLAIERAMQLFGADYANVQPHSGSQANAAVFQALLEPGDPILGMSLSDGGHLTHGSKVNFSGKLFDAAQYGVDSKTGLIDYDEVQGIANEHKPRLIIAGFSAYSRILDWQRFRDIADSVGAYLMVDMAHVAGLVATGHYPNPMPIADVVTTTTHKTLRGPRGGLILARKNEELAKKFNSLVFPGNTGWSADARHRREGRGISRSNEPGIQGLPGQSR